MTAFFYGIAGTFGYHFPSMFDTLPAIIKESVERPGFSQNDS